MRQRCTVSSIHTLRPTSVFVRIFIDIMHSPALYPNLSIWPPNPDLKSILTHLKTTPFEVMRTSQIVPTFQKCPHIACGTHITSKRTDTPAVCTWVHSTMCSIVLMSCVTAERPVLHRPGAGETRRLLQVNWWTQSYSKNQILCRTITFMNHYGGFQRVWTEMAKFRTQLTTGVEVK